MHLNAQVCDTARHLLDPLKERLSKGAGGRSDRRKKQVARVRAVAGAESRRNRLNVRRGAQCVDPRMFQAHRAGDDPCFFQFSMFAQVIDMPVSARFPPFCVIRQARWQPARTEGAADVQVISGRKVQRTELPDRQTDDITVES